MQRLRAWLAIERVPGRAAAGDTEAGNDGS